MLCILCPCLAANCCDRIEDVIRIVLVLYMEQLVVVLAIEDLLEIRLPEVAFAQVGATTRRQSFQRRQKFVADDILHFEIRGPIRIIPRPTVCQLTQ